MQKVLEELEMRLSGTSYVNSKELIELLMNNWKPDMKFQELLDLIQTLPRTGIEEKKGPDVMKNLNIEWKDYEYTNVCASACMKNGKILFVIRRAGNYFYTIYPNERLFTVQICTYFNAANIAKEKFGEDSIKNRLEVAKEIFLENYKKQIADLRAKLDEFDVWEEMKE